MLGALIPVSDSLRTTGASDLIATQLAHIAALLPAWGAVALTLVTAMAVTPFLTNAATVLVMAPDRTSVVAGKSVAVRVDSGGRRSSKTQSNKQKPNFV